MTRTEFIEQYAKRSGIDGSFASHGFIDVNGRVQMALPCNCGESGCEGWAMVSPDGFDTHMKFRAPERLAAAYRDATNG